MKLILIQSLAGAIPFVIGAALYGMTMKQAFGACLIIVAVQIWNV